MSKKPKNIFTDGFKLPEKVCVLAPGPNGKAQWARIDCPVIAVNYAVHIELPTHLPETIDKTIPRIPEMWMIADWWGIKTDWFPPVDKTYRGIRIFSENMIKKRPSGAIVADWSFQFTRGWNCQLPLGSGAYTMHPRELRPNATSSCIAIELAARFGAKEIAVCGVDFFGKKYYNNREGCFTQFDRTGPWVQYLPFANSLMAWIKSQGIDIYSLSETELDLEVRDNGQ